jgi:hypothetical protein
VSKPIRSLTMVLAVALPLALAAAPGAVSAQVFSPPQKVTPFQGAGYEPAVVVDNFGNIFVTAHKENWQLALAPDVNSPTYTRSMSWLWTSADDGVTFPDPPGWTALRLEQHEFGDEGDLALDDAGHLYFVDTNVADDTITRWSVTGRGHVWYEFNSPLIPSAQPLDDRPWVTAHGDGVVFYFGNEGDKTTYPLGQGSGSGFGPGRYTVYASYDGGQTFDSVGYTLNDSGWCRPAADHAPGSRYVYAVCTNDGGADGATGTLWAYVSADDGHTFSRYRIGGYNALDSTSSWPTVVVAADGSVWALYVDATTLDADDLPVGNRLRLFHSTDHGRTWKEQDVTRRAGRYEYGWLAVSRDGKQLGLGIYYKPDAASAWRVYGAAWKPGQVPTLVSLDENNPVTGAGVSKAPADLMASAFGPDGKLSVVWTRYVFGVPGVATVYRDIYFARSR